MAHFRFKTAALAVSFCLSTSLSHARAQLPLLCVATDHASEITIEVSSRAKQSVVRITTATGSDLESEQSSGVAHYEFEHASFPMTINLDGQQTWVVEADCAISKK